jgi:carbon-monoxide dehydrogenase iron sulfur subunit
MSAGKESKRRRVMPIEEACIGCHLCQVACITEHSRTKDPVRAYKEENPRPRPRNVLMERGHESFSLSCRHCDEPLCVDACIAGGMVKDMETGRVEHKPEKCVGCWSCVMNCPFGAVQMDLERNVAIKCDLCPDRDRPACVEACPNRALILVEVEE